MKTTLLILSLIVAGCSAYKTIDVTNTANADTRQVMGEETWSGEVVVKSTIRIMPGAALELLPGTTLLFSQSGKKRCGIIIEKDAQLLSNGENGKPVVMTTRDIGLEGKDGWLGITAVDARGCTFIFTNFSKCSQAINSTNTDILIYQSTFRLCSNPVYFNGGNVRILSSIFEKNKTAASFKNGMPKIVRNTFVDNDMGIYFMENSSDAVVHENNFYDNRINIEFGVSHTEPVNLVQNYWATSNLEEIFQRIRYNRYFYDKNKVHLVPFAIRPFQPLEKTQ